MKPEFIKDFINDLFRNGKIEESSANSLLSLILEMEKTIKEEKYNSFKYGIEVGADSVKRSVLQLRTDPETFEDDFNIHLEEEF